jgi:hypothetical protein
MKEIIMKVAAAVILALAASMASADDAAAPAYQQPPEGEARISAFPERDAQSGEIHIPVIIDLKDVVWNDAPAVLGGYVVRFKFDPKQVAFIGSNGGLDPYFAAAPIATAPEIANLKGWAKLTYAQLNTLQPVGMVNVAKARFTELVPGGASSIEVILDSASSAMQRDEKGNLMRKLSIAVRKDEGQAQ